METIQNTTEFKRNRAIEKVEKLKGFYTHLAVYLFFVPVFVILNVIGGSNFPWAIFPILGWGFGIAGHASETFGWSPFFGKEWEAQKIRQFMNEE